MFASGFRSEPPMTELHMLVVDHEPLVRGFRRCSGPQACPRTAAAERDGILVVDKHAKIHARIGRYLTREPLKQFEAKLDPAPLARAHRSASVNLSRVRLLDSVTSGQPIVTYGRHTADGKPRLSPQLQVPH